MSPICMTCSEEPITQAEVDAIVAEAIAGLDDVKIWPGNDWTPASGRVFPGLPQVDVLGAMTGVWDGYDLTGLEYASGVDQHACRPLWLPNVWEAWDLHVIGLASSFGSGTVRFYRDGMDDTAVELEVAAFGNATLWTDLSPGSAPSPIGRLRQMPITRQGSDAGDDLEQGFCVLAFYGTPA